MYKGYQEEMFQNPWGVNVGFKDLADKLCELLPFEGRCENPMSKNKNLEKDIILFVFRVKLHETNTTKHVKCRYTYFIKSGFSKLK